VKKLVDEGRLALAPGAERQSATYHDSCHLKRTLHAEQAPRALLGQAGVDVKEMAESDVCCGMGGSYSVKLPEISAPMLRRKLGNVLATGAPLVAADCPGCVMQLRGGLDQAADPKAAGVEVRHTAELLAERVRPAKA
jgi:Fe-S oxidoreductase